MASTAEEQTPLQRWQEELTVRITLPRELLPLRTPLVWDNLTGHHAVGPILWLLARGIMPLFAPLGGSNLNMAESIQRILKRRALGGQHPNVPHLAQDRTHTNHGSSTEIFRWFPLYDLDTVNLLPSFLRRGLQHLPPSPERVESWDV